MSFLLRQFFYAPVDFDVTLELAIEVYRAFPCIQVSIIGCGVEIVSQVGEMKEVNRRMDSRI